MGLHFPTEARHQLPLRSELKLPAESTVEHRIKLLRKFADLDVQGGLGNMQLPRSLAEAQAVSKYSEKCEVVHANTKRLAHL